MCGIVGSVGRGAIDLGPALDAIRHRGPDDTGRERFEAANGVVDLGFVRLSILDLSPAGHQPMANEDGSVWVVFNGEIYNFAELRAELEALGHRFRSATDTETIVHCYEQYGDGFVHRLRGMFALAIWDRKRERLVAYRDRLGIKPLFWSEHGGRLTFASEMKALLALGVPRDMAPDAIAAYLRYLYVPPPLTMFRAIRRLPPGHRLVWEKGATTVERYWDFARPVQDRDDETIVRQLRALLDEVVAQHLAADVPLGVFLSGGLDSSTITALVARHSRKPVRTFCMTFGEGEQLYDEREYASLVARRFGTEHVEIPVKADVEALLPTVIRHFDEPFGNPTALLVYALSRETRRHVTVALAGDGGDEIFLGYPRYQGAYLCQHYRRVPKRIRALLASTVAPLIRESTRGVHGYRRVREFISTGTDPVEQMYEEWIGYYGAAEIERLTAGMAQLPERSPVARLFDEAPSDAFLDRMSYVDLKSFLPDNLLRYTDHMSMASSLEVRVPFCDHRLAEFMAGLSFHQKMTRLRTKALFKRAVGELLPAEILSRRKLGFNPPMGIWINHELRGLIDDRLDPRRLKRQGLFDATMVTEMIDAHRSGRRDYSLHLWALVVFQVWSELYQGASA